MKSYSEDMLDSIEKQQKSGKKRSASATVKKAGDAAMAKKPKKKKAKKGLGDRALAALSDSDFMKRFK